VVLRSDRLRFRSYLEETSLDKKIPYPARLVDIDFDEVACFSSSEFASSSGVFTNEGLLDD